MAARQDQSQQIFAITSLVLFLVMAIVAYLTWNSSKEEFARAEELKTQKADSDNVARQKVGEAEKLIELIGLDPQTPYNDVVEQYEKDKEQFMSTFEEGTQSYRTVLDYIFTENEKIAQQEAEAKKQVKQLEQQLVALEAEKQAQVDEALAAARAAKQDLAAERTRFNRERESIDRQKRQLAQTLAAKDEEFSEKIAAAVAAQSEAEEQLVKSERSRATLQAERRRESPSSETADGQVTYVNQATQTAWINLGEADALRRQVTFSVFDSELNDAVKAEKKGSLEVIRLLGDNLAEAKITSDDPRDPILPGDRIYSQVWQRGKELRFALTGLIDLDGDGLSDLQRAKDLVALNGAMIDASLEEDGTTDGEMTVNTRYLVLGDSPDQPSKAAYRDGYQRMSREAAALGVETITLADFLNRMGYRPAEETLRFTGGRSTGGSPAAGGRSFRFRTP
ncbi:MAG: hypothetical protein AAF266_13600 [Planctomycetota bacterium]